MQTRIVELQKINIRDLKEGMVILNGRFVFVVLTNADRTDEQDAWTARIGYTHKMDYYEGFMEAEWITEPDEHTGTDLELYRIK